MMNRDKTRGFAAVAVTLAVLGGTSAAHALTDQDRWAAHQQLTQAQDLKKQGQLQDALTHYEESVRLDPKLASLMELAECEEQLGKLIEAQSHFIAARDKAVEAQAPQSKARAEQRAAALDKRLSHLTLQLSGEAPAGVQVFRDDALLEPASLGTPLVENPGEHVIVVKATEHADAKYDVKLADGESQTLSIAVGASTKAAPPPPPPPKPAPVAKVSTQDLQSPSGSGSGQRTLGLIVGAVGIVGVGVGSPLWYVGYRDGNSIGPDADRNLLLGQISVIGGGALLVTGIVLFATAPSGETTKTGGLRVTPLVNVGSNATVLGAAGQF
jgi:hypothetical protein